MVSWGSVAIPTGNAPIEVGGTYAGFFHPDLGTDGRVAFKGSLSGALTPVCAGGPCSGLFVAQPDVDCTNFIAPSRTYPSVRRLLMEGDPAISGVYFHLDQEPSVALGAVLHRSCYGPTAPDKEAILEGKTLVESTETAGLPCGSHYGPPQVNLKGVAYWRALFEAIVFHALSPGPTSDLVVSGGATLSRLGGLFANLGKARSAGWEGLPREVAAGDNDTVAFIADVIGDGTSATCLGTDPFCDAIFVSSRLTGQTVVAVAKNDTLATGGTIARFCGPPSVNDTGVVAFRAVTDPAADCDPASGSSQGVYVVVPPFVIGTARAVAHSTLAMPDGLGGSFFTSVFSDPAVSLFGSVVFRAGPPGVAVGTSVVVRASAPYVFVDTVPVARKGLPANPTQGIFSSFDPGAPGVNLQEEIALLTTEGIWVSSPTPVLVQECLDKIAECRGAVVSVGYTLLASESRALQSCHGRIAEGKIAPIDCRTQDLRALRKIDRVRMIAEANIERYCSDDVIPLVGACNRDDPTVQGETECLISTHAASVDSMFGSLVPQ
jgi:hypothetical protein